MHSVISPAAYLTFSFIKKEILLSAMIAMKLDAIILNDPNMEPSTPPVSTYMEERL